MSKTTDRKDYWLDRVYERLELVEGWARVGCTDAQIAINLGISKPLFREFLDTHSQLADAVERGRRDADILVENALFRRAIGYQYVETTKERRMCLDEDGNECYRLVTTKKVVKQVAPDVNAQIYWLERRVPKRWQRTPEMAQDIQAMNNSLQSLARLIMSPVTERAVGSENIQEDGEQD